MTHGLFPIYRAWSLNLLLVVDSGVVGDGALWLEEYSLIVSAVLYYAVVIKIRCTLRFRNAGKAS